MTESLEGLRKFHNWVKMQLILDAKKKTNGHTLLDVAVGRGGDIMKWTNSKLKFVTGFDIDNKSIYEKNSFDGAIKRYHSVKHLPNVPRCYFWNISAIDPFALNLINGKDNNKIYDIVSCQFSFHYFVNDIDITLNMISKKLKTNGYFIGTAADGDVISSLLSLNNGHFENDTLCLKRTDDQGMYSFELKSVKSSRETYFEYRGASIEYFLYKDHLIEKCKNHGLELIEIKNFSEIYDNYKYNLTENEQICSFLNFSFVFKKV
jgi:ubiquinone/menaquinone biosynthesis C-methylase UbiE